MGAAVGAFTAFSLVLAVAETITGRAGLAVFFWGAVVMELTAAWRLPGALEQQHANAQAAADFVTDQIGR